MKSALRTSSGQYQRLVALQVAFAQVCNALSPLVQQTRVWNRVALHHMAYRSLRQQFPAMGSQMVCNAIYAVSRTSRLVYQTQGSPCHLALLADRPLPLLRFADTCPVYFDRHTLSLKHGQVSMFTLDGRMKFQLPLSPSHEEAFHRRRILEIVLQRRHLQFELAFKFGEESFALSPRMNLMDQAAQLPGVERDWQVAWARTRDEMLQLGSSPLIFPDYLKVEHPV